MANFMYVYPTIAVSDKQKSKEFYEGKLGLSVIDESDEGFVFQVGDHCNLYIFQRPPTVSERTIAAFETDNIEATVDELTQKGIAFEHYDFPDLKTDEKGIAMLHNEKAAWFKDPDGHVLSISQHTKTV